MFFVVSNLFMSRKMLGSLQLAAFSWKTWDLSQIIFRSHPDEVQKVQKVEKCILKKPDIKDKRHSTMLDICPPSPVSSNLPPFVPKPWRFWLLHSLKTRAAPEFWNYGWNNDKMIIIIIIIIIIIMIMIIIHPDPSWVLLIILSFWSARSWKISKLALYTFGQSLSNWSISFETIWSSYN